MVKRGNAPLGADGKPMSREDYVAEVGGAFGMPNTFVGKREEGTPGSTTTQNKKGETTHVLNAETGRYEPIKMSTKNKSKAPFKMKGFSGFNKY